MPYSISKPLRSVAWGSPDSLNDLDLGVSCHSFGEGGHTKFLFLLRNGRVCMATQKLPQSWSLHFPSIQPQAPGVWSWTWRRLCPSRGGGEDSLRRLCLKGKEAMQQAQGKTAMRPGQAPSLADPLCNQQSPCLSLDTLLP